MTDDERREFKEWAEQYLPNIDFGLDSPIEQLFVCSTPKPVYFDAHMDSERYPASSQRLDTTEYYVGDGGTGNWDKLGAG